MKTKVNLAVGVPCSTGLWHDAFGMCMVHLVTAFMRQAVPGYDRQQLNVINSKTSLLQKARRELAERAIEHGCTHLLYIDTDQTFPAWTAHALLSHKKPVVAANIATKIIPSAPTARGFNPAWAGGDVIYTRPESRGLEQVWRIGTGLLLIDLAVLATIPKPWFGTAWREQAPGKFDDVGEDWFLMERLEQAGVPIYIDHDLSKHVGHVGAFEYKHELIWAEDLRKELTNGQAEESEAETGQAAA